MTKSNLLAYSTPSDAQKLIRELSDRNRALEATLDRRTSELHRLLRRLAQSQRETSQAHIENMRILVELTDSRHQGSGGHLDRIGAYAGLLGRALGLTSSEIRTLELAAPMHDIGKVAIPDQILSKAGLLTEDERKIVQTHTTIGHGLLKGSTSEIVTSGAEIALTHHERWDGSGYPHQRAGEDIPLFGRMVAIIDVFDALTTERPYRLASTPAQALATIEAAEGQFDPAMVSAFQQNSHRFISAHEHLVN